MRFSSHTFWTLNIIFYGRRANMGVSTGAGANWSFNLPVSGTSGLPGTQQRTMGTMGSFAQSLGGSQSAAPLDLS